MRTQARSPRLTLKRVVATATLALLAAPVGVATASAASAAPAAGAAPAALVAASSVPGPNNTGVPAGVKLKSSGSLTITKANTVIDGLDVKGSITVRAEGVVIKNTRVTGTGTWGINVASGSATIVDTEISGHKNAIIGSHWSAKRVNIHSTTEDGVKLGSRSTLEDSWIHDLTPRAGAHADGGQVEAKGKNVVVRNNVIDVYNKRTGTLGNSALIIKNDLGSGHSEGPITITGNYLNGGNFTVFAVPGNKGYLISGVTITNNRFGPDHRYGTHSLKMPVTFSGNSNVGSAR